ncbi:hypothetical protein LWI29_036911 [Acer saccharum]|uniref:Protein kinase domain-containing protein n=1 Tax=Acer saccharum TaxID=4024 RepID=A0AA39TH08_ACESA|nr:hypothetical protein LWI29_036911 [Acer saccharum]
MEIEWVRGDVLGHGSFASVNLAKPRKNSDDDDRFPSSMAVKSCDDCCSSTLKNEKEVLDQIGYCQQIVRCFGDSCSVEKGERLYNLFLEYASRGSLADQIKRNSLKESDVKRYTRSVLKGLLHIHAKGFVHCDIKLQNLLLFDDGDVKIADFGLAKKSGNDENQQKQSRFQCRGTPLYMSPESVNENEYESPGDIWALGCAIVEMVTGKPAWNHSQDSNLFALLIRIGVGDELPLIPEQLSQQGKDFLIKCFIKDPKRRWTAEMLLNHPFVVATTIDNQFDQDHEEEEEEEEEETKTITLKDSRSVSPRSPFSFPDWVSIQSSPSSAENSRFEFDDSFLSSRNSSSCLLDRIRNLAGDWRPEWSDKDCWVTVR